MILINETENITKGNVVATPGYASSVRIIGVSSSTVMPSATQQIAPLSKTSGFAQPETVMQTAEKVLNTPNSAILVSEPTMATVTPTMPAPMPTPVPEQTTTPEINLNNPMNMNPYLNVESFPQTASEVSTTAPNVEQMYTPENHSQNAEVMPDPEQLVSTHQESPAVVAPEQTQAVPAIEEQLVMPTVESMDAPQMSKIEEPSYTEPEQKNIEKNIKAEPKYEIKIEITDIIKETIKARIQADKELLDRISKLEMNLIQQEKDLISERQKLEMEVPPSAEITTLSEPVQNTNERQYQSLHM